MTSLSFVPLADRMRPTTLDEFVGQHAIVGEGTMLRDLILDGPIPSLIFWGPPGVGKTTLAHIIGHVAKAHVVELSGVTSGKADLTRVISEAKERAKNDEKTILFIDEIHRWNKAQQDALLPHVEKGVVTLIGATTENPSFEIIGALLSRTRVFILESLQPEQLQSVLTRALVDIEKGLGKEKVTLSREALEFISEAAGGDARAALNTLELAVTTAKKQKKKEVSVTLAKEAMQRVHVVFDKRGEEFYNAISVLHKSMRGSDPTASLYWLARMLEGGADPLYVARRVVRFASEDIGMANSEALIQANAAYAACHTLGMPECAVHLAQAVVYCAKSKKSNLLYTAYKKAADDAKRTSHLGVPIHLRNAPTTFMKDIGYGKDYKYNPNFKDPVEQDYMPDELLGVDYFVDQP
jgi:putative ATPase